MKTKIFRNAVGWTRLLTLLVVLMFAYAQVWAATGITPPDGFTAVSNLSDLSDGDYVILITNQAASRVGLTGWNNNSDGTVSSTASEWIQYRVDKSSTSFKLYDPAAGAYMYHDGTGNNMKYNGTGSSFTIDEGGSYYGRLKQTDAGDSNDWYLQKSSSNIRFYHTSNTFFYVCKATTPNPPDPAYITINTPISINAGTYTGSELEGTSGSYTLTFTFNSCGYDWWFENYTATYSSSDDEAYITIKYNNGTAYSNNQYYNSQSANDCSSKTETVKFDYYVSAAGSHTGNLIFYGYNSSTYDQQYVVIPFTVTATATCSASTVTAGATSNATANSLTFNCSGGISTIGCEITEYGYVWGTSENPTTSNSKHSFGSTYTVADAAFSSYTPTNLACNTTYYMRPYAINSMGTSYGTQSSLKTSACPVDHFIDDVHSTTGYTGDGMAKEGDYSASIPTIADKAERSDGNCQQRHYHFVGWVTAANKANPEGHIEVLTGTATGTTYYAVWAQESSRP